MIKDLRSNAIFVGGFSESMKVIEPFAESLENGPDALFDRVDEISGKRGATSPYNFCQNSTMGSQILNHFKIYG